MKVTRVAYSRALNTGKYGQLVEQARRLGRVRSLVWDRYGSLAGVGLSDRQIRDGWMADGTAEQFGVLANAWKETVRDAVADIRAHREAAKVLVRRWINRATTDQAERKRLYALLKHDQWISEPRLRRLMRAHWRRGHNHTANQIIVRADKVRTFTLADGGNVWLAVPGLTPRSHVAVPLNTTVAPTGTLRLVLRDGRVEVHYQVDAATLRSNRPCGEATVGVDKGYTEVLTDSDGQHHGVELGGLLRAHSDQLRERNARRARLRSIANQAAARGDHTKAERVRRNNLGTVKKRRQEQRWRQRVRTETFRAVHAVVDKADTVVAEDLTRTFTGRKQLGANVNRRLAAWTKGVTAEALANVSERRGSALRLVNAAYTSQVAPCCDVLGRRVGDQLDCTRCGVVWQADHAAAVNVLGRAADPDIGLHTPHTRVRQIIQERADRHRSRLPDQDSNTQATAGVESETSVNDQL